MEAATKIIPFSGRPDKPCCDADHLQLVDDVADIVEKWREYLPWLFGWRIMVLPVDENDEDWPMQIASYFFARTAHLNVKPSAADPVIANYFPPGEYSLELLVLHELCHLLFERTRQSFVPICNDCNSAMGAAFMEQEEELAAWRMARALMGVAAAGLP